MNTINDLDQAAPQPPLAAVDFSVLAGLDDEPSEGETDLITELIDLYLGEVPQLLDSIRQNLQLDNWKSARRAAHTLRGSSANLGVLRMSMLAGQIERLTETEMDAARVLCDVLEQEFVRVTELLMEERRRRAT